VVEAAEVGDELGAADVAKRLRVRLEHVEPAVRHAAHGVADVVAADGDVEMPVPVHVAKRGLPIVGHLVLEAHPRGDVAKRIPCAFAEIQPVADPLVVGIGYAA
jgi:hypothetical protein